MILPTDKRYIGDSLLLMGLPLLVTMMFLTSPPKEMRRPAGPCWGRWSVRTGWPPPRCTRTPAEFTLVLVWTSSKSLPVSKSPRGFGGVLRQRAPPPIWQKGGIWLETNIIVVLDYTEQKLIFGLFENTRLIIACRREMTRSIPLNGLINCLITASLGVAVLRQWVTISSFCQIYWTMPNLYLSKTAIEYSTTEIFSLLSYLNCNYTLNHIRKTSNSW